MFSVPDVGDAPAHARLPSAAELAAVAAQPLTVVGTAAAPVTTVTADAAAAPASAPASASASATGGEHAHARAASRMLGADEVDAMVARAAAAAAVGTESVRTPAASAAEAGDASSMVWVSPRQQGNPVLTRIRLVPWRFVDGLAVDYVVGRRAGVLFLSVRYHLLNPEYIFARFRAVQQQYKVRVLLLVVDTADCSTVLQQVGQACLVHRFTLMVAWSVDEAARIIETFKVYEDRPLSSVVLAGGDQESPDARRTEFLAAFRFINRTDATTLLSVFGSVRAALTSTPSELLLCPGLGDRKVQSLLDTLRAPFARDVSHTQ